MKSIIIDDEATARAIVAQLCGGVSGLEVIGEFPDAVKAQEFMTNTKVDLLFLDIHMPGFTGLDFIAEMENPPKVILITSDKNAILDAYEFDAVVDYLVKPLNKARFEEAVLNATK